MGKLADKYRKNEELWSVDPFCYCGFFVKRKVMQEIMKKTTKFEADIRDILEKNFDDIYAYEWTLHNIKKDNKILHQKTIYFISSESTKRDRLRLFKPEQPKRIDDVFECNYETAKKIAEELNYEEQSDVAED